MKKYVVIVLLLAVSFLTHSTEVELKVGLDIYRDLSVDASGDGRKGPTEIYPGFSIGLEAMVWEKNPYRYGLGLVWHNSANGKNGYEGHSTSPLYLVGKYDVRDDLYLIGRGGWGFAKAGDATEVERIDGGLYGGFGIGRNMNSSFNAEFMYEIMGYRYITPFDTEEDGHYQILSLVLSYKFWPNS